MKNYNDGKWHGWNGGKCPVHPKSVLEYVSACNGPVRRESSYGTVNAEDLVWCGHDDWNIVAFRVIKEHREPREWWVSPICNDMSISPVPGYVRVREVIE